MNIQGRLMQARFIEMHQVFVKTNMAGFFFNRVVYYEIRITLKLWSLFWKSNLISELELFYRV